jgi:hypothetical protein
MPLQIICLFANVSIKRVLIGIRILSERMVDCIWHVRWKSARRRRIIYVKQKDEKLGETAEIERQSHARSVDLSAQSVSLGLWLESKPPNSDVEDGGSDEDWLESIEESLTDP